MFKNPPKLVIPQEVLFYSIKAIEKVHTKYRKLYFDDLDNQTPAHKLLKYFPKYLNTFLLKINNNGLIHTKLKRAKIFHIFESDCHPNLRRTLLYNKEKHIQAFWDKPRYSRDFLQDIRTFTGLQTLKLRGVYIDYKWFPVDELHYLKKVLKSIGILQKLKTLSLEIMSDTNMEMISKTRNHWKRRLDSLKTFKISCSSSDSEKDIWLFQKLLDRSNLLRFTTHLRFYLLEHKAFYEIIRNFVTYCPNLIFFRFILSKQPNPQASHHLQALQNLHHLRDININCLDSQSLLKEFNLPSTIQKIKLDFWSDEVFKNFGDENLLQTFLTFCDKWSHFNYLENLQIEFPQYQYSYPLNFQFLSYWLNKIKTLKNLSLILSSYDGCSPKPHLVQYSKQEEYFDLSDLLNSIQHLKNSLQSLKFSDYQLLYSLKSPPQKFTGFHYLRNFSLKGELPQEVEEQNFFHIDLRDLIIKRPEEPLKIVLEGLKLHSFNIFWEFLEILSHDKQKTRILRIELTVFINEKIKISPYHDDTSYQVLRVERKNLFVQIKISKTDLLPDGFESQLNQIFHL